MEGVYSRAGLMARVGVVCTEMLPAEYVGRHLGADFWKLVSVLEIKPRIYSRHLSMRPVGRVLCSAQMDRVGVRC